MFEMLAGRSPFDVVGGAENPDQNTEDYLFQGLTHAHHHIIQCSLTIHVLYSCGWNNTS